jgi:mannosyltransferase OCH1-like enzyme
MRTFGIYTKIPLNVFQVAIDKKIFSVNLRINNPEFNFFYFDENDCDKFILNNYPDNIYKAYKSLIPLEYKFDFWKYCILYKYGGIYIDDKYIDNIKLINLIDYNFFASYKHDYYNKLLINTDFIVTKSNNPIFMIAINEIIKNINNNYYGIDLTYPTGAGLLGKIFIENKIKAHLFYDGNNISFKNIIIMKTKNNNKKSYYTYYLWITKNIYNKQK